jgi:hypothetical protein
MRIFSSRCRSKEAHSSKLKAQSKNNAEVLGLRLNYLRCDPFLFWGALLLLKAEKIVDNE